MVYANRWEVPDYLNTKGGLEKTCFEKMGIELVVSGIGIDNARLATANLCDTPNLDLVLSIGFCGSLCESIPVGKVIVANRVGYEDRPELFPDISVFERELGDCYPGCQQAPIKTSGRAVLSREEISPDWLVVDMESYGVLEQADKKGIRSGAIKVASDVIPKRPYILGEFGLRCTILKNFIRTKKILNLFLMNFLTNFRNTNI